MNPSVEFPG